MDRKGPSFLQILRTDYGANLGLIAIAVLWGILAFDVLFRSGQIPGPWFYIAVTATVISLALIAWRTRRIGSVFEDGREVDGNVTAVSFFRDRGRITYIYSLNGQRYQASNIVSRNSVTRRLGPGQNVIIMVDPDRPKAAFIKELYI